MESAAADLLDLMPDGLQLTPGNHPTTGFDGFLRSRQVRSVEHHGFSFGTHRRRVWNDDGTCAVDADSVHPPAVGRGIDRAWRRAIEARATPLPSLETMYPGHELGTDESLRWAMDRALRLAVDVSHIFIQMRSGDLRATTWRRLQDYARIAEIHVSANGGVHDTHRPLESNSFGLAWAQERRTQDCPVVLECYMHRLSHDDRRRQVDLARGVS